MRYVFLVNNGSNTYRLGNYSSLIRTSRRAYISYNNQWEASGGSGWKYQYAFPGGVLSNSGGTSGITRSSGKWYRGPVLFSYKECREMITSMQRSTRNYPRSEGEGVLDWERLIFLITNYRYQRERTQGWYTMEPIAV